MNAVPEFIKMGFAQIRTCNKSNTNVNCSKIKVFCQNRFKQMYFSNEVKKKNIFLIALHRSCNCLLVILSTPVAILFYFYDFSKIMCQKNVEKKKLFLTVVQINTFFFL